MGPEKLALRHRRVVRYAQDSYDDHTPEINEDPLEGFERAWQVRPHDYHGGWKHGGGSLHKPLKDDYPGNPLGSVASHTRMAHTLGQPHDNWEYDPTPVDRAYNLPRVLGQNEYGLLAAIASHLGPDAQDAWHQVHRGDPTAAMGLLDMAEERGLLEGADQVLSDKIRRQINHGMLAADDASKDNGQERFYDESLTDLNGDYMLAHADTFDTLHGLRDADAWRGSLGQFPPHDPALTRARLAEANHQAALAEGRKDTDRLVDTDFDNRKNDPLYWGEMVGPRLEKQLANKRRQRGQDAEQQALRRHHAGTGQPAGQRGTVERQRQLQGHVEQQEQSPEQEPQENLGKAPYEPPYQRKQQYGALRSPAGGVVVRGIHYPGGKWIPAKGPESTSYSKWEKIHKYQRGDGSFDYEGMSGDEDVVKLSKSIDNLGDYAHPKKKVKQARRGQKVRYAHPDYVPEEQDWPDREEANPFDQQSQPAQRTRDFLQTEQQDDAPNWETILQVIAEEHPDLAHLVRAAREGDHAAVSALLDEAEDRGIFDSTERSRRDFDTHRQWIAQGGDRPQRPQRPVRW